MGTCGVKRLLLALGVLAYLVGGLAWLAHEATLSTPEQPGSSLDTSPAGASLAYEYLAARRGGAVERLTSPLSLRDVPPSGVVLRIRPLGVRRNAAASGTVAGNGSVPVSDTLLSAGEEAWVRAGGRLVVALAASNEPIRVEPVERAVTHVRKVHPRWPAVVDLRPAALRALAGAPIDDAVTLFAAGDRPAISLLVSGAGELVLLTCPEVLENGLLQAGDHLALLEALAAPGRPVLFDEHAHGFAVEKGLLRLLLDWGLGPALALASLAGLAVFWRGRSRVGLAEDTGEDRRSDAIDLVGSLAQLYRRALRRDEAALLYYDALRHVVSLRSGLRGGPLEKRVRQLTGNLDPPRRGRGRDIGDAELTRWLARINRAFGEMRHGHSR